MEPFPGSYMVCSSTPWHTQASPTLAVPSTLPAQGCRVFGSRHPCLLIYTALHTGFCHVSPHSSHIPRLSPCPPHPLPLLTLCSLYLLPPEHFLQHTGSAVCLSVGKTIIFFLLCLPPLGLYLACGVLGHLQLMQLVTLSVEIGP